MAHGLTPEQYRAKWKLPSDYPMVAAWGARTGKAVSNHSGIGRLEQPEGFGPRRAQMIRTALAERLGRPRLRQLRQAQQRPRFPCCLTWTASIGQGQVPGMGVHGALFQCPPRPRTGWTADSFLRPRDNARSLRKRRAPDRTSCGERREAAAASLQSQAEQGAMGGGCSC